MRLHLDRNYKLLAVVVISLALFVVLLYGLCAAQRGGRTLGVAAALLTALGPLALGGLVGFLFGLPKTIQASDSSGGNATGATKHAWAPNTNLEQVSDWLTKILIGVGLTQLNLVPGEIQDTGEYVASAIGPDASPSIVIAILIVFAVAGFTVGYLLTKFDLGRAIDHADDLIDQMGDSVANNPGDRRAVEHLVYGLLYAHAPDGYLRAIDEAEAFLRREANVQPGDADLLGYLACAYGQKFAYLKKNGGKDTELDTTRDEVMKYATAAIAQNPAWKLELRQLVNPPVNSNDDDLAALQGDSKISQLLGS